MAFKDTGAMIRLKASLNLATLGSLTAVQLFALTTLDAFRLLKMEWMCSIEGQVTLEGPVALVLADGDLSVTEVKAALEIQGPVQRGLATETEIAERAVWPLDIFDQATGANNNTRRIKGEWKKRWTFHEAKGYQLLAYNMDPSAALTGATTLHFIGTAFGVWL